MKFQQFLVPIHRELRWGDGEKKGEKGRRGEREKKGEGEKKGDGEKGRITIQPFPTLPTFIPACPDLSCPEIGLQEK